MTDGKWDKIDALARRQQQSSLARSDEPTLTPLAPIEGQIESIREQKLGLIGHFKKKQIDRNAALEKLRNMHDAQVECVKHALRRAVDIEKRPHRHDRK